MLMIKLGVYNREGKEVDSLQVDEALFGSSVRYALLKQALVMYHANKRVGTAATKSRGMVEGSTRKLYRQKGTGNARAGTVRTNIRKGGGVAFAKQARDFGQDMPVKQRRLAKNSAILAKLLSNNVVVIDELKLDKPRTRDFVNILNNLKIDRSCIVAVPEYDDVLYKSLRNVPKVDMLAVADLNAWDICNRQKLLFTKDAFAALVENAGSKN
jgi:large subunit ribosomal protein L4